MTEPAAAPKSSSKLGLTLAIAIVLVICAAVALIRPVLLTYVAGISLPLAIIYAFETARPRLMAACCTTIGAALSAPVGAAARLRRCSMPPMKWPWPRSSPIACRCRGSRSAWPPRCRIWP